MFYMTDMIVAIYRVVAALPYQADTSDQTTYEVADLLARLCDEDRDKMADAARRLLVIMAEAQGATERVMAVFATGECVSESQADAYITFNRYEVEGEPTSAELAAATAELLFPTPDA